MFQAYDIDPAQRLTPPVLALPAPKPRPGAALLASIRTFVDELPFSRRLIPHGPPQRHLELAERLETLARELADVPTEMVILDQYFIGPCACVAGWAFRLAERIDPAIVPTGYCNLATATDSDPRFFHWLYERFTVRGNDHNCNCNEFGDLFGQRGASRFDLHFPNCGRASDKELGVHRCLQQAHQHRLAAGRPVEPLERPRYRLTSFSF